MRTYMARCAKIAAPSLPICTTTNAVDALQIVRDHAAELRLILLDAHMPVLDGRAAAVVIRQLAPNAWIVPCTGDAGAFITFSQLGCALPMAKPLPPIEQLVALLQGVLNGPAPQPLILDPHAPFMTMVQLQLQRITTDYARQPHVYRALLNPVNDGRSLIAVPKTTLDQAVTMLRTISDKFGGNRLLGRSIKMLTDVEQSTTTHTTETLPHVYR